MADYAKLGAAATAVFSNPDLVNLVCLNHIGPATFSAVSRINRTTRDLCRTSKPLLRSVAYFTGALTTTQFRGLFALQSHEAARLPHQDKGRYRLYSGAAIETVLAEPNVMQRIAKALPDLGTHLLRYKAHKAAEAHDAPSWGMQTPEKSPRTAWLSRTSYAPPSPYSSRYTNGRSSGYKRSNAELEEFHRGRYLTQQRRVTYGM